MRPHPAIGEAAYGYEFVVHTRHHPPEFVVRTRPHPPLNEAVYRYGIVVRNRVHPRFNSNRRKFAIEMSFGEPLCPPSRSLEISERYAAGLLNEQRCWREEVAAAAKAKAMQTATSTAMATATVTAPLPC